MCWYRCTCLAPRLDRRAGPEETSRARAADFRCRAAPAEAGLDGLAFGGDYNPEQWPRGGLGARTSRLMREAGVNLVSVGIFAWALLEPRPGRVRLRLARRVLDLLHERRHRASTSAPRPPRRPPGSAAAHPEALPVDRATGARSGPARAASSARARPPTGGGGRGSPTELADRYARPPGRGDVARPQRVRRAGRALLLRQSRRAFRAWLRGRYGDARRAQRRLGHRLLGPALRRLGPGRRRRGRRRRVVNPAQQLDFTRFCRRDLRAYFTAERDILHGTPPASRSPRTSWRPAARPWTTGAGRARSTSSPTTTTSRAERADTHVELAMAADLTRVARGRRPWLLMEHSTSAVNWQPRNLAKAPGEMAPQLASPTSPAAPTASCSSSGGPPGRGAEKFHSAMLPHARHRHPGVARGRRARRDWAGSPRCAARRVTRRRRRPLGLGVLRGRRTRVAAPASTSTTASAPRPSTRRCGRPASPSTSSTRRPTCRRYRLVVAPALYLLDRAAGREPRRLRRGRRHLLVSYFSRHRRRARRACTPRAVPARCATCSACRSRSSRRCARATGSRCTGPATGRTCTRPTSGPSSCAARRRRGAGRLRRRPAAGPPGGHPAPARSRDRLVRRDPARTRPAWPGCSARSATRPGSSAGAAAGGLEVVTRPPGTRLRLRDQPHRR